jgi:hypothetical protein
MSPTKTCLNRVTINAYFRGEYFALNDLSDNDTVKELKETVQTTRGAYSVDVGQDASAVLSGAVLLVYTCGGGDVALLRKDAELLEGGDHTYYVYELFGRVPVDLFRRVGLRQLHPAVRAASPGGFTNVSPLYSASIKSYKGREIVLDDLTGDHSPFYCDAGNQVQVRGASLTCVDKATSAKVGPLDVVTPNESKEHTFLSLDNAALGTRAVDSFGVLHSTMSFNSSTGLLYPSVDNILTKRSTLERKKAQKGETTERMLFFRFKLPKGVDLTRLGMAVVFDDGSQGGHFTLIPLGRNLSLVPPWFPDSFSEPHVWDRHHTQRVPTSPMPEAFGLSLNIESFIAFPLVAEQFVLHDFLMVANGLPDADEPQDDDGLKLFRAVKKLLDDSCVVSDGIQVSEAIDSLGAAHYCAKKVLPFFLRALQQAFEDARAESGGLESDDDSYDIFDDALQVLKTNTPKQSFHAEKGYT